MSGRRYQIEPRRSGFEVLTSSKQYWRYTEGIFRLRRRTRPAARLIASLAPIGDDHTRILLKTRLRKLYLLDVIWVPLFISSIVVPLPWRIWVIVLIVTLLFGLSYAYHYYNAAYQANEMVFFVEKALQDTLVTQLPTLEATTPDIVHANQDFQQEWERFYNAHQRDT